MSRGQKTSKDTEDLNLNLNQRYIMDINTYLVQYHDSRENTLVSQVNTEQSQKLVTKKIPVSFMKQKHYKQYSRITVYKT